jgi:hypothetical protein
MVAHASVLHLDVETQAVPSQDAGQRRLRMTWFFQGTGLAALMLIGVAAMGGFPSGSEQHSWQTVATSIQPEMVSSVRAEGRPSSIELPPKTREIWNLWATAYTAFVHELAPSEESVKLWWAGLGQELPTREFFESQMTELKAVQAKVAPVRRLSYVAPVTPKTSVQGRASTPIAMAAKAKKVAKRTPKTRQVPKGRDPLADSYADLEGLQQMAMELNPKVGYYDPLKLAEQNFWGQTNEATIGFLREAEIKHGRIAMFGFVGFIVHNANVRWPWAGPWDNIPLDISPQECWDLQPAVAKAQIIGFIAFLEFWRENTYVLEQAGEKHYMRGGKPGYFPPLDENFQAGTFHPVPFNLFDPFKLQGTGWNGKGEEENARGLIMEINNGRLAMIGLMGFLAESSVEGSVPGLTGLGLKHYDGNVMAPFSADFSLADYWLF